MKEDKKYSTKDIAQVTHLSLRKVQYYAEKNVIKARKEKMGRGFSYVFTAGDVIRYLIVAELSRFKIPFDDIYWTICEYFGTILKKDSVKEYLKKKLFLNGKFFYIWTEWPYEGEFETIVDALIETGDVAFPECYFVQGDAEEVPRFRGFKLAPCSSSAFIIDMAEIYRRFHEFNQNLTISDKSHNKKTSGTKA